MLVLVRYINLILLIIFVVSLILAMSVFIRAYFATRYKQKNKSGEMPSDAGVRDLVAENRIDEAVNLYQKFTGVDKFTAQKAVEDIDREIRLSDTMRRDIEQILTTQGKAAAIEAYQKNTGAELEDALTYVENMEVS